MKPKRPKKVRSVSASAAIHRVQHEAEAGAVGAFGGAVVGCGAGLPGAIAGAILGGIAGAIAGGAIDSEDSDREAHTRVLDAEIGVSGGDLGSPNLRHPPERNRG
jgi:outer membrane lipoprotein SlyB